MLSSDDRVYSRPLETFPVLKDATDNERNGYTLEMRGTAVRWIGLEKIFIFRAFTKRRSRSMIMR